MRKVQWLSLAVLLLSFAYFVHFNWTTLRTQDTLGPAIVMEETQIYASVKDSEEVLLKGITAEDAKDGDVTESLVVESISDFVDKGERYVNYAAFDSDNHVTKASRKIIYTDYEPTHFSLEEPLRFVASTSQIRDVLGNVHAQDCLDGDVSERIRFSADSNIDLYSAGDYPVTLQVKNSGGDITKLPVTISIYENAEENAAPKIRLSQYLVYTSIGVAIDPLSYIESVTYHSVEYGLTDGTGTFNSEAGAGMEMPTVSYSQFEILNQVDYQTPGVYEIQYFLEEDDENTGKVNLIVVVEEA